MMMSPPPSRQNTLEKKQVSFKVKLTEESLEVSMKGFNSNCGNEKKLNMKENIFSI